jgi:hypothetical protein
VSIAQGSISWRQSQTIDIKPLDPMRRLREPSFAKRSERTRLTDDIGTMPYHGNGVVVKHRMTLED